MGRRIKAESSDEDDTHSPFVSFQESVQEASRTWRVWVGHVPTSLCVNEAAIRAIFEPFGAISKVTIHHDALSSGADGFMYLDFNSEDAARGAVEAVTDAIDNNDAKYEGMRARRALTHGETTYKANEDIVDLLLGRRQASAVNSFSQHSVMEEDDDELVLQSLSQRSIWRGSESQSQTNSSKAKHKSRRTKRKLAEVEDD